MFKNVLIAEDFGIVNKGVVTTLEALKIKKITTVQYCDDAHLKIKKAIFDKNPFDLLITDLHFKQDYRDQKIVSGEDLIAISKVIQPELKIIVFSIDDRLQKARTLMQTYGVDGYVCKDRHDFKELSKAMHEIFQGKQYLSTKVKLALKPKSNLEIDDFDINLINFLSKGISQSEITEQLKKQKIYPNSLSSIEKHLNILKIQFKAKNSIHLVSIFKDLGLI